MGQLGGSFKDILHAPPLLLAQWPRFDQQNLVAHMARILFIVRLYLLPFPDILFVDRVEDQSVDHDHHGLVHLIA